MCSFLCKEFHLTAEQIGQLTPYQVKYHYLRPDDQDGTGKYIRRKEQFWATWRRRGLSEREIAIRWREEMTPAFAAPETTAMTDLTPAAFRNHQPSPSLASLVKNLPAGVVYTP